MSSYIRFVALWLGPVFLLTSTTSEADAAISKLLCHWRFVTCVGVPTLCGKEEEQIYTIDFDRNLVGGTPARITGDFIFFGKATINRKTGSFSSGGEDYEGKPWETRGECHIAPKNKF